MMLNFFRIATLALLCLLFAPVTVAQTNANDEIANIKKALDERFPKGKIANIRKSPIAGLYEATLDTDLVYVDASGKHLIAGPVYNIATMDNIAEARVNELFGFKWEELPLEKAIKFVRGKGERRVAVFTDADCPFCRRIEQTFQTTDNITVYNFLMPIDSLHPDAGRKSKIIWCAKDRLKAWQDYMLNDKLVDGKGDCPNPVEELKELGKSKRVNGTPALIFPDNKTVPGAIPKDRLEEALTRGEQNATSKKRV